MLYLHALGELHLSGPAHETLSAQRKDLAILLYLVRRRPAGATRAELAALIWGERDEARARHSLRQSLLRLRRRLAVAGEPADVLEIDNGTVRVVPGRIQLDVAWFEAAVAEGRTADAVASWTGDFLADAEDVGGEEFRLWVEEERVLLQRRLHAAFEHLVSAAERTGDDAAAALWASRWAARAPFEETPHERLVLALHRSGRRDEAIARHDAFVTRLHSQLDLEPSAAFAALRAALNESKVESRRESKVESRKSKVTEGAPSLTATVLASRPVSEAWWRRPRPIAAAVAGLALVLLAAVQVGSWQNGTVEPPLIAVGRISDQTGSPTTITPKAPMGATVVTSRALSDMLATSLARLPGFRVVSNARMNEVLAQLGVARDEAGDSIEPARYVEAATRAGARDLLEGELYRRPDGRLLLDLRRLDIRSGDVREGYSVEGADPFEVVDHATMQLGGGRLPPMDTRRLSDFTTSSLVAYRFYEEGLRAFYQGDDHAAYRLFQAALEEDSTFAMAAYYTYRTQYNLGLATNADYLARALALSEKVSDRERLLIRAAWSSTMSEPAGTAIAETLAIRYPSEPDAFYLRGRTRVLEGNLDGALGDFMRVVAMDSLSLRGTTPHCRACDALNEAISTYILMDSIGSAERVSREWTRRQPRAARPWVLLATTLDYQDRPKEALAARQVASTLQPGNRITAIYPALVAIRAGDFTTADRILREHGELDATSVRIEAYWFLCISLRNQGRLEEALVAARRTREMVDSATNGRPRPPDMAVLEAQTLAEMGRTREAVALFDSLGRTPRSPDAPGNAARRRVWMLTHSATALAPADTLRLATIADTLEWLGQRSAYRRDAMLHHYVRGLLLSARGDDAAAEDELRRAVLYPSAGYSRINFELARTLIRLGRPREAVATLQPTFRGPLESGNLYVTRTELHAALGDAFAAADRADSAAAHYRIAADAWKNADPQFAARRDAIEAALRGLGTDSQKSKVESRK
jgi:DNA-binding SARP family transcriptional activator/predicted Zn-dependent protease